MPTGIHMRSPKKRAQQSVKMRQMWGNYGPGKTKVLTIRVTEDQFKGVKKMAKGRQMTVTSLILEALNSYSKS